MIDGAASVSSLDVPPGIEIIIEFGFVLPNLGESPGSLEIDNERKRCASTYFSARSKFRKSGGGWSFRVGMR